MNKNLFCVTILFLFFIEASAGRKFYVSSSYSGGISNGSFSTPWKTLADVQNGMSTFVAGDSILFKRGDKFNGTLLISKSGTATSKIVFSAYGVGADPLFWGTGNTIANLFNVGNQSHIVFYGLKISDTTISSTDRTVLSKIQTAFGFDVSSSYNVIRKCTLDRVGVGVFIATSSSHNTIDSCDIGNMRMVVNDRTKSYNDYGANPTVISGSYNTITNNFFHDCWANSYDFGFDGGAVEFYGNGASNNFIAYNTFYDCNGVVENGSGNGGTLTNNTFAYNKFINNGSLFYINNSGIYTVNVSNLAFYNNVIIETVPSRLGTSSLGAMSTNSTNQNIAIFKNNIFYVTTGTDVVRYGQWSAGQLVHQNNIYKLLNGSVSNFSLNTNETLTSTANLWLNTINTNPLYWDYSPVDNSSAIDFGQNIGYVRDFAGRSISGLPEAGILEKIVTPTISPLLITVTSGSVLCNGASTTVTVAATGGVAPYSGTGNFTATAGTYNYTVRDAVGNSKSASISIVQPSPINITLSTGTITSIGGNTYINVAVTGGSGNGYTYKLNNGSYQTSPEFRRVPAGTYTITVKDSKGCTASKTTVITQTGGKSPTRLNAAVNTNDISNLSSLRNSSISSNVVNDENIEIVAFPNPTTTGFSINYKGTLVMSPLIIAVFNGQGQKVFETKAEIARPINFGNSFNPGFYYVSVLQNGKILKTLKLTKS